MLANHVMNIVAKIGDWVKNHRRDLWVGTCLALATWSAYNVGRLRAAHEQAPAAIALQEGTPTPTPATIHVRAIPRGPAHTDPRVVASKTSTSKKYHFTWCTGASKIKEANKLWFATAQAAQAAGYTLAANCH